MNSARLSQRQDGTTYSLVLTDVTPHDAGVYTCVAHNAGGQVLCKAELLVHGGELAVSSQTLSRDREQGAASVVAWKSSGAKTVMTACHACPVL